MSKSHHNRSIRKDYVHKLLLDHAELSETQYCYKIIKTHENKGGIIQLYNLA